MTDFSDQKPFRAAWSWLKSWEWRIICQLVYLIVVLAFTVPIIFYALAAYQFQVDAAQLAEEQGVEVEALITRAAIWNEYLRDQPDVQQRGNGADHGETGENGGTTGSDATSLSNDERLTAHEDLAKALWGCDVKADEACDGSAWLLASQLQRFDQLALPDVFPLYGRPSVLAELPGWSLTLVVTLVAGLLGSMIFVLKAVLRQLLDNWAMGAPTANAARPWPWLLLRPVFGVVIALGAYVALQSGLLAIDGAMSLQPSAYVTAAVGLVAGLLSWHVIDLIEAAGQRWLSSNRPRWGYGLKPYIAHREEDEAALAERIGVSKSILQDWMDLRIPVPREAADKLAAELKVDPDTLFQNIPPWRRRMAISDDRVGPSSA